MPDDENLENQGQINPYKEILDQLIIQLSKKFEYINEEDEKSPKAFINTEIQNWNRNVDLYWKWETGGNQPPVDPEDPDPYTPYIPQWPPQEELPMDIVVSRNEVINIIREAKKRYIQRDRQEKLINATGEITESEWEEWKTIEENKYAHLSEIETSILLLDADVLKEEWTPCEEDLPTPYIRVLTSDNKEDISMNYVDSENNWKNGSTGDIITDREILAWMFAPQHYEKENN